MPNVAFQRSHFWDKPGEANSQDPQTRWFRAVGACAVEVVLAMAQGFVCPTHF